ncbi:MAG: hypothetical protein GC152_09925 [Alphaproteobacteria bacterium]|nr:hypothetical protein [Alphaproteobacteria bacterium]
MASNADRRMRCAAATALPKLRNPDEKNVLAQIHGSIQLATLTNRLRATSRTQPSGDGVHPDGGDSRTTVEVRDLTAVIESIAFVIALIATVAALGHAIGRRPAAAPALVLGVGLLVALGALAIGLAAPAANIAAGPAKWGLAALGFTAATQFRVRLLSRLRAPAFRLATAGAPLAFAFWALTAFVMLPQTSMATAGLIAAALLLNGAAFDRKAVLGAPAPAVVKQTVRLEGAAITAFGLPIAAFCIGAATAAGPSEPQLTPLLLTTISMLKGFVFGGLLGFAAARIGRRLYRAAGGRAAPAERRIDAMGGPAVMAGFGAALLAPVIGGDMLIAAVAAGLVWSEEAGRAPGVRRVLQRLSERAIPPAAYFAFGFLMLPRLADADMLTTLYAVAAVTILRAAPRLAALSSAKLPEGARNFIAWYGGAPGAGSALFLMMLTGEPAIANLDPALTVGSMCVACGVIGARASSKPLLDGFLQAAARGRSRRAYA